MEEQIVLPVIFTEELGQWVDLNRLAHALEHKPEDLARNFWLFDGLAFAINLKAWRDNNEPEPKLTLLAKLEIKGYLLTPLKEIDFASNNLVPLDWAVRVISAVQHKFLSAEAVKMSTEELAAHSEIYDDLGHTRIGPDEWMVVKPMVG